MVDTCQQLISNGITALIAQSNTPELDAELLLAKAVGQNRSWLLAYQDEIINETDVAEFQSLLQRRAKGEPIAYIFGEREFWSLPFKVNNAVLIPRPETEILVETVLKQCLLKLKNITDIKQHDRVLKLIDLGTGSGAVAVALCSELKKLNSCNFSMTATDQSQEALAVAQFNAEQHAVNELINFQQGLWFNPIKDKYFDIIASNPPYIAENDYHLQQGDIRFEPATSLVSGIDGLQDIHHLIQHAPKHLNTNGMLFIEHGFQQAESVQELFKSRGFNTIRTTEDYSGNPRVTTGTWLNTPQN